MSTGLASSRGDRLTYPHKIRIKARVSYDVVWVDRFDCELTQALCDGDKRIIYILKDMSAELTLKRFIHETLHALEFEWRIPIPHKVIELLEDAIFKLLKLNGWIPVA